MNIQALRLSNGSVAVSTVGDEYPDNIPQQFGLGEHVAMGEIIRTTIGIAAYMDTGWNADPCHPTVWERVYMVQLPLGTVVRFSEAELLAQNPRYPSAEVQAFLGFVQTETAVAQQLLEATAALFAIQRLIHSTTPDHLRELEVVEDTLAHIEAQTLLGLGRAAAPVILAGYSVTGL